MADTAVAITAGAGTNIDTRTEATNGNHRQVIVIGDPATNAGVAPVDATNGLAVYNVAPLTVASHAVTNAGTFAVQVSSAPSTAVTNAGTFAVQVSSAPSTAVTNAGTFAVQDSAVLAAVTDATIPLVAHDAADSGDPLKIGAKATASLSAATMVAAADRTNLFAGLDGVLINRPHTNLEDIVTGNATNTDGTSTSCIASSGAGIKTYLTSVVLCNTSATAITVDIKDGSTTKVSLPLPAGSGCVFNPPVPIPGTAATAWSFDPSAAATTVTCSMIGFKSKV